MPESSIPQLRDEEKQTYIDALCYHLPALRAEVGLSQGELAKLVGLSRQTYSAAENQRHPLSWEAYLALLFFFSCNRRSRALLQSLSAFPTELIAHFNGGEAAPVPDPTELTDFSGQELLHRLDEQARHALHTLLLIEYARCTGQSGSAVIKAFNGKNFLHDRISKKTC